MHEDNLIAISVVGFAVLFYLLPFIWVLLSRRSQGGAKFGWFLVVFFFSWLGLAAFLIFTQANSDRSRSKSIIATGLQVFTALFLITLTLWWLTMPDFRSQIPTGILKTWIPRVLAVLTWPIKTLHLPIWMWPVINLIQSLVLVSLFKIFTLIRTCKNAAA